MFIGHFAVGFAAKRAAPGVSLGVLMAAALLLDLLWPVFLLAGWETVRIDPGNTAFTPLAFTHYPISHSLAATVAWALLAAFAYWGSTRHSVGATIVALAVASHWFLDALVHRPDLPLYPGSSAFAGLGLWNSISGTLAVEGGFFLAGVWIYVSGTRTRDRIGIYGLWSFLALLVILYLLNVIGPPPPSARAIAITDLTGLLFPIWAAWFDRHRVTYLAIRA